MVAIIAGLAFLNEPIAAAGQPAAIGATIAVLLIAIVAVFHPQLDQTVTASSRDTTRNTGVVIGVVAIVAGFKAQFSFG